ncbi:hypothetical protein [Telmatospirillum sp.]|uniref:hypothetical protein n=1 Tax=Telmatospirillum sp. TaxID=2079197 RepID=UPI002842F06E|nr:hypothetical protein [Telmatospirillum sp.]MDR3435746.1 hypothetical protein [Telmatospirillum sp.]
MPRETVFICQPYVRGARASLKAEQPIPYKVAEQALLRAQRMMASGHFVGVDVVRQTADPEIGDYDEPVFLERLGSVPMAAD